MSEYLTGLNRAQAMDGPIPQTAQHLLVFSLFGKGRPPPPPPPPPPSLVPLTLTNPLFCSSDICLMNVHCHHNKLRHLVGHQHS